MHDRTDTFTLFATELARNPELIDRLLAEHPPDGPCTGCRLRPPHHPHRARCGTSPCWPRGSAPSGRARRERRGLGDCTDGCPIAESCAA